ncbi:MAG: hypothetical protein WCD18_01790 [Thermosynechococcaceae cyanobacterium]
MTIALFISIMPWDGRFAEIWDELGDGRLIAITLGRKTGRGPSLSSRLSL